MINSFPADKTPGLDRYINVYFPLIFPKQNINTIYNLFILRRYKGENFLFLWLSKYSADTKAWQIH